MAIFNISLEDRKVISIGMVSEITGLSKRQIRYYEERKLISPGRALQGYRIYSFSDIEVLMEIANQIEDGVQTFEIKKEFNKRDKRNELRIGQIHSHFKVY